MNTGTASIGGLIRHIKDSLFSRIIYPEGRISYDGVCDCFLFSLFVMPYYFGVRLAFFDLTALRFFEILLLFCIWKKKSRRKQFLDFVFRCPHLIYITLYMIVVVYTNLIHPSLNTIFYWFMNGVFVFFFTAYIIIYEWGITLFLKRIRRYAYILTLISPLELVIKKPPFSFLDTLNKSITAERFGSTRIMGNCSVSNGYAMYLCILLPLLCYDCEKKHIDIWKNKFIIVLILINVFLTGSRLTVGTAILALCVCFIGQNKKLMYRSLIVICIILPTLAMFMFAFQNVGFIRSILCTVFSAVDEVFETSFSANFGADTALLNMSSEYRDVLLRNTIFGDWLNPLLGRGGSYKLKMYSEGYKIYSMDNFFVGQYVAYAWPGLVTWLVMSASFLIKSIKGFFEHKDWLLWTINISIICYFISLWYLDQLMTFPIMFTVFSLVYAITGPEKARP